MTVSSIGLALVSGFGGLLGFYIPEYAEGVSHPSSRYQPKVFHNANERVQLGSGMMGLLPS